MMASYRGADDAERRSKAQATKKTAIEQQQQRATRSKQQQAQSIIMATSSRELGRSDGPKGILREERERGSEYANPPFVAAREDEASPSQRSGNNNHLYDTSGKNNHENNRTEQSRYISRAKRDLDAAASEQTTSLASQLSQANSSGSVLPPGAASGSASASGNNRFGVLNSDTATQANKVDRNRVMPPFPALSPGQESSASSSQHSSRNAPTSAASGATPVSPHGVMGTPPGGPMASPLSSAHGSPAPLVPPSNKSGRRGNNKKDTGTPRGVPHVYHDFAAVSDTTEFVRKKTGGVTQPFPEKLHELLEKETTPDFHENVNAIVGWLPHGRAFLVRKPKEFTRDIMPKYFRQTKLTSFQRQLNLYGFRRLTQGPDAGAYYHELFLRGRPHLCLRMARQKVKGTGHKQPADAQTEPNFYVLPPTTGPHSPGTPPQIAAASPTSHSPAPVAAPSFITEMSPGTRGVHGAASLLKGIAAGLTPSRLKNIRVNPNSALPYCDPAGPASSSKSDPPGHNSAFAPASVPPRSSYSSLLWGTAAATRDEPSSAPAPAPAPSASYLWPQPAAAPQGKLDPEDEDEEDEQQEADEEEEEEEDQKQAAV